MTVGPFFVSQVPKDPLLLTVTKDDGTVRDLTGYSQLGLMIYAPNRALIDLSSQIVCTLNPPGTVSCAWPAVSLFTVPGEYTYQIAMDDDLTDVAEFEVRSAGRLPTSSDVLDYLASGASTEPYLLDLAAARVPIVTTYVRALTRGQGFVNGEPNDELAAVITTAAAREINISPGIQREELGTYNAYYGPNASEFSLRELMIIRSYRRMAC